MNQYKSSLHRTRNRFEIKDRTRRRDVTDLQYNRFLQLAKERYVDKCIPFTRREIKTRYRLTANHIDRLYSDLIKYQEQYNNELVRTKSNVDLTVEIDNKSISIEDRLQQLRQRWVGKMTEKRAQTQIPEGFVYLIRNSHWPNWIKVGMTLDYINRLSEYNVYDPTSSFEFIVIVYVQNRRMSEKELLRVFDIHSDNKKGEWFEICEDKATQLFRMFVV